MRMGLHIEGCTEVGAWRGHLQSLLVRLELRLPLGERRLVLRGVQSDVVGEELRHELVGFAARLLAARQLVPDPREAVEDVLPVLLVRRLPRLPSPPGVPTGESPPSKAGGRGSFLAAESSTRNVAAAHKRQRRSIKI